VSLSSGRSDRQPFSVDTEKWIHPVEYLSLGCFDGCVLFSGSSSPEASMSRMRLVLLRSSKARLRLPGGSMAGLTRYPGISRRSTLCEMSQLLPPFLSQSSPLFALAVFHSVRSASLHPVTSTRCPRDLERRPATTARLRRRKESCPGQACSSRKIPAHSASSSHRGSSGDR
jgi:hypothetical protein